MSTDLCRDDLDLKQLARDDRPAALNALCARHHARLVRHARGIVRDDALAADVVQEVLIKAMREPRLFDTDFRTAAWLYRVTTNLCLNTVRNHKRRGDILASMPTRAVAEADQVEAVLDDERARRVEGLLSRLSEAHQAVLRERFYNDLSYAEIAAALDLKLGTVMSRLSRARSALLDVLDGAVTTDL